MHDRPRALLISIALGLALAACPPAAQITPSRTARATILPTGTPTKSVSRATPTSTVTLIPGKPPIELTIETISPDNRVVDLSELGLGPGTIVLLMDSNWEQVYTIGAADGFVLKELRLPEEVRPDTIEFSPDGKQIAFLVFKGMRNSGTAIYGLWISGADGRQPHEALGDTESLFDLRWLSDRHVAISWYQSSGRCPGEVKVIDATTGEVRNMPNVNHLINAGPLPLCFPIPFYNPDLSKGIIVDPLIGWKLIDFNSVWRGRVMAGVDATRRDKYRFSWDYDGVSFAFPEEDRIAFDFSLSEEELLAPDMKPEVALLPTGYEIANNYIEWWQPDAGLVGFGVRESGDMGTGFSEILIAVDLNSAILRDYALDMGEMDDRHGEPWFVQASVDGRFIGWPVMEPPRNHPALGSVILNLETGRLSYIDGLEIVGFGEIETGR